MITSYEPHPWVDSVSVHRIDDDHEIVYINLSGDGKYASLFEVGNVKGALVAFLWKDDKVVCDDVLRLHCTCDAEVRLSTSGRYTIFALVAKAGVFFDASYWTDLEVALAPRQQHSGATKEE